MTASGLPELSPIAQNLCGGRIGVFARELRFGAADEVVRAGVELEAAGFSALWVPGGTPEVDGSAFFDAAVTLLAATDRVKVVSSILSIWSLTPAQATLGFGAVSADYPGRLSLGFGVSHSALITPHHGGFDRPHQRLIEFFDALDERGDQAIPKVRRMVGAQGPRMLELARERSAGAHPFIAPFAYIPTARAALGPDALLAPVLHVVLDDDPTTARAKARTALAHWLALPNYRLSLVRSGFSGRDLASGGSNRLIDALVAWGDEYAIARQAADRLRSGADVVAIHVLGADGPMPWAEWRRIGRALTEEGVV